MTNLITLWLLIVGLVSSIIYYFAFDLTTATGSFLIVAILAINIMALSWMGRLIIKQKSPGVSSKRKVNQDDYGHQFRLTKQVIQRWVVHVRDKDLPCISCGTESKTIVYAGGHLRSAGGHPELALNSHNIHKQCNFYCNCNLSGNLNGNKKSAGYIKGLIERHGQEYHDRLFEHREQPKITIDQLKEIRAFYSTLIRDENSDDSKCPYIVR